MMLLHRISNHTHLGVFNHQQPPVRIVREESRITKLKAITGSVEAFLARDGVFILHSNNGATSEALVIQKAELVNNA